MSLRHLNAGYMALASSKAWLYTIGQRTVVLISSCAVFPLFHPIRPKKWLISILKKASKACPREVQLRVRLRDPLRLSQVFQLTPCMSRPSVQFFRLSMSITGLNLKVVLSIENDNQCSPPSLLREDATVQYQCIDKCQSQPNPT